MHAQNSFSTEIQVTIYISATMALMAALAFGIFYGSDRRKDGLREWFLAFLIAAPALIIYATRGITPQIVSIFTANAIFFLCFIYFYQGARRFCGLPSNWISVAPVFFLSLFLLWKMHDSDEYIGYRALLASFIISYFSIATAAVFHFNSPQHLRSCRFVEISFIINALSHIVRICVLLSSDDLLHGLALSGTPGNIVFGSAILAIFIFAASLIAVTMERLQHELKCRIRELDEANGIAHLAMREQQNFLTMMSHEFRTPLGTINASTNIISMNIDEEDEDSHEEISRILRSSERLGKLVETCLSGEWLDHTLTSPTNSVLDLGQVLRDLGIEYDVRVSVYPDTQTMINGDTSLLPVVFSSLIDNARKYGRTVQGTEILCRNGDCGMIAVEVLDDGPGVAAVDLPNIFEKYYRSEKTMRQPGVGLGLYMVRRIVNLHGGRIEVENSPRSVFRVLLPNRVG